MYARRTTWILALISAIVVGASGMYFLRARADQMKSTQTLVLSSDVAVSSQTNAPFTLYIGDNITNVSSPLKSMDFTIEGDYTGGGTIAVSINSNSATTRTFTLPTVSTPTSFSFLYKDWSNTINPSSSGQFSGTLNIIPSGLMLYGLSATLNESHQYTSDSCPDGSSAGSKEKTTTSVIAYSDSVVQSATTSPFTLYIGDVITATSSQSMIFTATGLYTGGGTITFTLDSDPSTAQTFTLPTVTRPTYYELAYNDDTGKITPTSAGQYTHTITTTPSGVSLYGFGISLAETHSYTPPPCNGYPAHGELYSAVFDTTGTTTGPAYNSMMWKGALGGSGQNQGRVRFQLAASNCPNGATNYPACNTGSWSFVGGSTCSATDWFDPGAPNTPYDLQASLCGASWNNMRYYRYAVQICSNDCTTSGQNTPNITNVIVNWAP